MKRALCLLLTAVCVLTAIPCLSARAADMEPPGSTVTCNGIRLRPVLFTVDERLIRAESQRTYADDLALLMVRFQVVDGYIDEDTLKTLADRLKLDYLEKKIQGVPWETVSFGKKIAAFDLIYASREISSLQEACLYCGGTRYSLAGLPSTGKALSADGEVAGALVTLTPAATPRPKAPPTPEPTKAPRMPVTPSPDETAELTRQMKSIRDSQTARDTMPVLKGKLFIAVFDKDDKLILTSSSYDWTHASFFATYINGIPKEWLADGYGDADTVILIYRRLSQVGTYQWGIYNNDAAYAAYTMLAAVCRGKIQVYAAHVSWPPSVKQGKGSAAGVYDYKPALNSIRTAKWESLEAENGQ